MNIQGYDFVSSQATGEILAVRRSTGEVFNAVTITVPAGTISYTPEEQEVYRERRKREAEKQLREQERRYRKNNTPKFCFISAEHSEIELDPATMARLVYLSTFLDYKGNLKVNSCRKMKFSDLENVLRIKKSEVYNFWNQVNKICVFADQKGNLSMYSEFSLRGKLPYGKRYQQIFIETVQNLYQQTKITKHKYLGYIFQMLPYINVEYNILCRNPLQNDLERVEPISIDEFCDLIGYNSHNRIRLMKIYADITFTVDGKQEQFCAFVSKGTDIGNTRIFVNPHILYHGTQGMHTQILGKLCDFSV